MYWPNGVPRVYAINGPGILPISNDELEEAEHGTSEEEQLQSSQDATGNPPRSDTTWANEAITGLCVSRSGHIFATMTDLSIAIWQTRVWIL